MRANLAIAITKMVVRSNSTNLTASEYELDDLFPRGSILCENRFVNKIDSKINISHIAYRASSMSEHYQRFRVSGEFFLMFNIFHRDKLMSFLKGS